MWHHMMVLFCFVFFFCLLQKTVVVGIKRRQELRAKPPFLNYSPSIQTANNQRIDAPQHGARDVDSLLVGNSLSSSPVEDLRVAVGHDAAGVELVKHVSWSVGNGDRPALEHAFSGRQGMLAFHSDHLHPDCQRPYVVFICAVEKEIYIGEFDKLFILPQRGVFVEQFPHVLGVHV